MNKVVYEAVCAELDATHTKVEVENIPGCEVCKGELGLSIPARYDARTRLGGWAYLCQAHFEVLGIGLGLGKGQELVRRKPSERR